MTCGQCGEAIARPAEGQRYCSEVCRWRANYLRTAGRGRRRYDWSARRQAWSERPHDPLTAHCRVHAPRRTTIRLVAEWVEGRPVFGRFWCLACEGCPRCGARQVWESIEQDDGGLFHDPLFLEGRPIRGDWGCLACGETLVTWSAHRVALRRWQAGNRARAEGHRQVMGVAA